MALSTLISFSNNKEVQIKNTSQNLEQLEQNKDSSFLNRGEITIKGHVTNQLGENLERAMVIITINNKNYAVQTNKNGEFEQKVPGGTMYIFCKHDGHISMGYAATYEVDTVLNITLMKEQEEL